MEKILRISLLLLCVSLSWSQNADRCLNEDHILEAAGCFLQKFEPLIDLIPADMLPSFTGRTLKSMDTPSLSKLAKLTDMGPGLHREVVGAFATVGKQIKDKKRNQESKQKYGDITIGHILKHFVRELSESIAPLKYKMAAVKNHVIRSQQQYKNDPRIEEWVCGIIVEETGQDVCHWLTCLEQYEEADFEDNLSWVSCLFSCNDLPPASQCVKALFNESCGQAEMVGDIMIRVFMDFLNLDKCVLDISPTTPNMTLHEGGPPVEFTIKNYVPPKVHCIDLSILNKPLELIGVGLDLLLERKLECDVQLQFSLSNYLYDLLPHLDVDIDIIIGQIELNLGRPQCRSNSAIQQAAIGWYPGAKGEFCKLNITEENWADTFTIPVYASIDHKIDEDVDLNFTVKLFVDGARKNTTKIGLKVIDMDPANVATCRVINDPHMSTFDQHQYNNFYQGYFYLYKHDSLPYEVQVINQNCSGTNPESCTCAVAVRSGDDVFVVDRCQRKQEFCESPSCERMTKVTMFQNGGMTPGTRVFKRDDGLKYEVLLPHGTLVKIETSGKLLNVLIEPSAYDRDNTTGLCGVFNEDKTDDLTLPNGTVYTGPGSGNREQPRLFIEQWRVPKEDRIFTGSHEIENMTLIGEFCKCVHVIIQGVQCRCGPGHLVEDCDLDTSGEITANISALVRKSRVQQTGPEEIDLDEDYVPNDLSGWNGTWTEAQARTYCTNFIRDGTPLVQECLAKFNAAFFEPFIQSCMEDIQITDSTVWAQSARSAANDKCVESVRRVLEYKELLEQPSYGKFINMSCLHDCNGRGECLAGICHCNSSYTGATCGQLAGTNPEVVATQSSLCDVRYEDCSFATIHGHNFQNTEGLKCQIQHVQVTENGIVNKGGPEKTPVFFINPNQVACKLPQSSSYRISLDWSPSLARSQQFNTDFVHIHYNSVCFTCDPARQTCVRKASADHCLINNACYSSDEINPSDNCFVCQPSKNRDAWSDSSNATCQELKAKNDEKKANDAKNWQTRVIVASVLSGVIAIGTLILFLIFGRKKTAWAPSVTPIQRKPEENLEEGNKVDSIDGTSVPNKTEHEMTSDIGHTNKGMVHDEEDEVFEKKYNKETEEFFRIKALTKESRERTLSIGSGSIGIGASGPMYAARFARDLRPVSVSASEDGIPLTPSRTRTKSKIKSESHDSPSPTKKNDGHVNTKKNEENEITSERL